MKNSENSSNSNNNVTNNETCTVADDDDGIVKQLSQIDLHEEDRNLINKSLSRDVPLSPTAKLLIETIQCVRQGVTNIPRSFLLSGPPGCGKTFAVKLAVEQSNKALRDDGNDVAVRLLSLRGSELLSNGDNPSHASKELALQFQNAATMCGSSSASTTKRTTHTSSQHNLRQQRHQNAVVMIFLDECDALVSIDSVAAMLATLLDKVSAIPSPSSGGSGWNHMIVVAATNRVGSIPITLRRAGRFDREIPMTPPNPGDRFKILQSLLQDIGVTVASSSNSPATTPTNKRDNDIKQEGKHEDPDDDKLSNSITKDELAHIADLCVGYVPADLVALVRRSALYAIQNNGTQEHITAEVIEHAMSDVGASALRDASLSAPPQKTWDDIAGDPGGAKVRRNR